MYKNIVYTKKGKLLTISNFPGCLFLHCTSVEVCGAFMFIDCVLILNFKLLTIPIKIYEWLSIFFIVLLLQEYICFHI